MRVGSALAVCLLIVGIPASASADTRRSGPGELTFEERIEEKRNGSPSKGKVPVRTGVTAAPREPDVVDDCLAGRTPDNPGCYAFDRFIAEAERLRREAATPAAAPPGPKPEVIAAIEYFKVHRLPVPKPKLSAPQGITGATHSIDLQMPSSEQFVDPATPFGELKLEATGTFTVDWGDGTIETYKVTGAPYPKSTLTHSWTDRGYVDISVTADWTVTWSYAGESGTVEGLQTTASIPQFQILELQAVITKG